MSPSSVAEAEVTGNDGDDETTTTVVQEILISPPLVTSHKIVIQALNIFRKHAPPSVKYQMDKDTYNVLIWPKRGSDVLIFLKHKPAHLSLENYVINYVTSAK